jgi:phosphate transport system permease protein
VPPIPATDRRGAGVPSDDGGSLAPAVAGGASVAATSIDAAAGHAVPASPPRDAIAPAVPPAPPRGAAPRSAARRRRIDRAAHWIVRLGGLSVILSLGGILVFLCAEALPLLWGPSAAPAAAWSVAPGPAGDTSSDPEDSSTAADPTPTPPGATPGSVAALLVDPYRTLCALLRPDGTVEIRSLADGTIVSTASPLGDAGLGDTRLLGARADVDGTAFLARTGGGAIARIPVAFDARYPGGTRQITATLGAATVVSMAEDSAPLAAFAAAGSARDGGTTFAAARTEGGVVVVDETVEENAFTGERSSRRRRRTADGPTGVTQLALRADRRELYGLGPRGELLAWDLAPAVLAAPRRIAASQPASALHAVAGSRAVALGAADGSILVLVVAPRASGTPDLVEARRLPAGAGAIQQIGASGRLLAVLRTDGAVDLVHTTAGYRGRLRSPSSGTPGFTPAAIAMARKGDGFALADASRVEHWDLASPHPEATLASLFGRIWYEGYPGTAHVWQSTGGSDAAEPKLGLTPLVAGTLKGTFYALLIAMPLGLLAAVYASQLMDPALLRWIKPVVELMASLPSVVLGFLAGLWLAPRVEAYLPGILLMPLLLPLLSIAAGTLFARIPQRLAARLPRTAELAAHAGTLVAGGALCLWLGSVIESRVLGGDTSRWLLETTGLAYEQRNALVAGIAMGFAVIPILFAIAEDALSNVPRALVSGSLALGATRWQTVLRVVLPAASPGLLAAVMIGFGRAIGETMIVLMATGNTPLLDFDPFSGFRTLSANIAVEVPEAPQDSTLYRVLFLSALVLFMLTFALNTLAEWIRERVRQRYAGAA